MAGPTEQDKKEFIAMVADRAKEFASPTGQAMIVTTLRSDSQGYELGISAGASEHDLIVMLRLLIEDLLVPNDDLIISKAGECITRILDTVLQAKDGMVLRKIPEVVGHA